MKDANEPMFGAMAGAKPPSPEQAMPTVHTTTLVFIFLCVSNTV